MSRPVESRVEGFDALREKTFQALVNYMSYGMNKPDFFLSGHHPDGVRGRARRPSHRPATRGIAQPQQQRGRGVLRSARERGTVMG